MKQKGKSAPAKADVVIMGAGPAGLTAGYELIKHGKKPTILEKSGRVGGIARTEEYQGYRFDVGGHRFYTKIQEVEEIWHELLGDDLLIRPRKSRILFNGKFFDYPLSLSNTISNLGFIRSFQVVTSYIRYFLFPYPNETTFEEWVTNRFGKKLFNIFFKTYTEKVWGIPTSEIRADWAAQRIKGLSLPVSIRNALFRPRNEEVTSLIEKFYYPRLGPGMMWEKAQKIIDENEGQVLLNSQVTIMAHNGKKITNITVKQTDNEGKVSRSKVHANNFVSSIPISELIQIMKPSPPGKILDAADSLTYRDFITVFLLINQESLFPDNWIYIHSPEVRLGRIQNFKNWSPEMVPNPSTTSLGLEYFCNVGDAIWSKSDDELIELGKKELGQIGIANGREVFGGMVYRQPKAYPIYTAESGDSLRIIREYINSFENLQTVGRNGLHKYNNQDHSMITALMAVWNIKGEDHNVWEVNTERSYYEEQRKPRSPLSTDEIGPHS